MRYQLRHAPELRGGLYRRPSTLTSMPMAVLFSVITVAFTAIAVWTAEASQWPIALAAGALAAWMASLAWSALRKTRS